MWAKMTHGFWPKTIVLAAETNKRYTAIYPAPDWSIFQASICASSCESVEHALFVYLPHCDSLSEYQIVCWEGFNIEFL